MTEPLVVQYLRSGGTLADLLATRGINAKRHNQYDNLVLLKYDQIESPMGDPIVQECRGIILDESDKWRVVSRGLNKFFNHGESHAAEINWSKAVVQEKVDGSFMTVYAYKGRWHVSTTGTPDASGEVNGVDTSGTWRPRDGILLPAPKSFAEYFWQILSLYSVPMFEHAPMSPWSDYSWWFEMTGPLNRVVVPHTEARLTLLGARHIESGEEISLAHANDLLDGNIPPVRSFPLQSMDDILTTFETMSPLAQEGYVIHDGDNRIKSKHPGYVALHHAKDGLSIRAFVEIAKNGEIPEVMAAFPELKPHLDDVRARLDSLVEVTEADFAAYRHLTPKKSFALAVKDIKHSAALFQLYDGKVPSARAYYSTRTADSLMYLLGLKT